MLPFQIYILHQVQGCFFFTALEVGLDVLSVIAFFLCIPIMCKNLLERSS